MNKAQGVHGTERLEFLDVSKGIGILLVVIGHHLEVSPWLTIWIYSFHMPLFFIISGWLYAHKKPVCDTKEMVQKKMRSLIYPYCIFSILAILFRLLLYIVLDSTPDESFAAMCQKTISTYGYHAMWFLPALFLTEVVVHQLENNKKITNWNRVFIYILLAVVGFSISEIRKLHKFGMNLEFILRYTGRVCISVVYYKIGMMFCRWNQCASAKMKGCIFAASAVMSVALCKYNGLVNLSICSLGNFCLYILLGACGSMAVIMISQCLYKSRLLAFWGKNSLFVMCTHMDYAIEIAYILLSQLGVGYLTVHPSVFAVITELLLLAFAIPVVNKYFRFLLAPHRQVARGV